MLTPADRERRKEALEWAVEFLEDAFTEHPHAATLREMLEEMEEVCNKCNGRGKVGGYWDSGPNEVVGGTLCPACHGKGGK